MQAESREQARTGWTCVLSKPMSSEDLLPARLCHLRTSSHSHPMGLSVQMAGSLRAISHSDHHRRNHSDHADEGRCWPQWRKWRWNGKCQLIDSIRTAPPIIDRSGSGLPERKSLDSDDFQLLSELGHQSEKTADKATKLAAFTITFLWGSWNDSQILQSLRLGHFTLPTGYRSKGDIPHAVSSSSGPLPILSSQPFTRLLCSVFDTLIGTPGPYAISCAFPSCIHTFVNCPSIRYYSDCNLRSRLLPEVILIVSPSYI